SRYVHTRQRSNSASWVPPMLWIEWISGTLSGKDPPPKECGFQVAPNSWCSSSITRKTRLPGENYGAPLRPRRHDASRLINFDLDAGAGALAGLAFDPHPVIVAKQHLQPFVDVADADTLLEQRSKLRFGNANTVIFHGQVDAAVLEPAPDTNVSTIHLAAQAVLDAVFDDRLQQHAGNEQVERSGVDVLRKTQLVSEANHLDRHVVIDKRELLAQRREII